MGFTKLDSNIIQSSIMSEPAVVFKVWIALLASTGPDGIARVSSTFLASVCYLDLDVVDRALGILETPDARSRTLSEDGRRIRRVDGGYSIINYEKYRGFTPRGGDPNSPGAVRTRRWREKRKAVTDVTEDVTGVSQEGDDVTPRDVTPPHKVTPRNVTGVTSASASASSSSSIRGKSKEKGVEFNWETKSWEGIIPEKRELWKKAYPACDIDTELAKATAWLLENPERGHKTRWGRFLTNWLSRTQDKGGTRGAAPVPPGPRHISKMDDDQ